MMMQFRHRMSRVIATIALGVVCSSANAQELERSDRFCEIEGLKPSLRQTLIIVDSRVIRPTVPENTLWVGPLIELLDPTRPEIFTRFSPRERVSVVVTATDGGSPATIFSGCLPMLTEAEVGAEKARSGGVASRVKLFFGQGLIAEVSAEGDHFNNQLARALSRYTRGPRAAAPDSVTQFPEGPLARTFSRGASIIDDSRGVPRLIVISDIPELQQNSFKDDNDARAQGFAAGEKIPGDLGRSDIFLLSPRAQVNESSREYLAAYFTRSSAALINWQTSALTGLGVGPARVDRFIGETEYGASPVTMRLRLGSDKNGKLVDSWVTVASTQRELSMPLTGTFFCDSQKKCTISGDGRNFSQVWSTRIGDEPELNPKLPFGGLQKFEATLEIDGTVGGKVYQPNVEVGVARRDALHFELKRVDGANF
jgi:hypothetical protein